jgi:hypothetical protein
MDKIVTATPGHELGAASAAPVVSNGPEYLSDKPRSRTFPLAEPFKLGGVTYTEIAAKRLNGAALLSLQKMLQLPGADPSAVMFGALCGVPPAVILALDAVDFATVSNGAKDFMPQSASAASDATGENGPNTPQT